MDIGTVLGAMRCLCANNSIYEPLCKQCKYLKNPKSKVKLLKKKLNLLIARGKDVENKLNEERVLLGKDPKAEVNLWVEDVKMMECSINLVELGEDRRCLRGCFPNYMSRVKLGKLVEKKIYEIDELLSQNAKFSESSLVSGVQRRGWIFPETTLIGESSRRVLETTWDYLMDGNIGVIGIYGMGGVGKTTAAIEINNRLLRAKILFDNVIWVTASKDSSIKRLQKDIADKVDLRFDENDDEMTRAAKLLEFLRRKSKFLLIIDDLWEGFPLESIGIPNPARENICKILITTRSLSVCHQMETDKEIGVGKLLEEEGWELFKQKVGAEVLLSPDIEDYARSIAGECGGLPLAIITVGRALRKETDPSKWEDALGEWRYSSVRFTNMEKAVFSRLRFSYERLNDRITKSCFLYCALYPTNHFIETDELVNYWMWEGLLGKNSSVKRMRQLGRSILRELKDASMLESAYVNSSETEYVKLHDLIREMAIDLTRETSMVQSGLYLDRPPSVENWSSPMHTVSLMRNDLITLDCVPECPNLGTLLLQYNSLKEIHPDFFGQMGMLRNLDLSFTGIIKLPESFSNLKKLCVLLLRSCWNLKALPTLEHLTCLMVLDLAYTSIKSIPLGMDKLCNLRHLDLSYTSIENLSLHVLVHYPALENLFVMGMPQLILPHQVLECLNLATLETNFETPERFELYIRSGQWRYLECFKFCIGFPPSLVDMQKNGIGLFGVPITETESYSWPLMHELVIQKCTNLTHLPEYVAVSSSELRSCKIQYCNDMKWIFSGQNRFPKLERLGIEGLRNLTKLCKGIRTIGFLVSLKLLHVNACDNLESLIPTELGKQLKNLEEIQVENCKKLVVIFAADEEEEGITEVCNSGMVLPGLKKMKLTCLPQLKSISYNSIICASLSLVEVRYCQKLQGIPLLVGPSSIISSVELINGNATWSKNPQRNQDDEHHQGIASSSS